MRKILMFCFVLSCCIKQNFGFCQQGSSKFTHFTTNDGLSDNYVQDVYQDSYGYLWLSTWNGLTRYDGYSFRVYRHNPLDPNSPSGNRFYVTCEDSRKRLWLATSDGGLMRYNRQFDNFTGIKLDKTDTSAYLKKHIVSMVIDENDNVWVCSNIGIGRFDTTDHWHWYCSVPATDSTNHIEQVQVDSENKAWGISANGTIFRYDSKNDSFIKQFQTKNVHDIQIDGVYFDKQNKLWIGTKTSGVFCVDPITKEEQQYSVQNSALQSNDVVKIYEDSKKNIWIGTVNGGVSLLKKNKKALITYLSNEYNTQSINSNSIASIKEDSGGNIWLGTHGGGINCLNYKENLILHYRRDVTCPNSVSANYVSCFYESPQGDLWVGTDGGGLNLFDRLNESFKAYGKTNGATNGVILNVCPDNNGNLWLSSWGGGIMLFDIKTKHFKNFLPDKAKKNWLSFPNTKFVFYENDTVWIATHGGGVNLYLTKQNKFISPSSSNAPFDLAAPRWGNKIFKDRRNWLWFITNNGAYMWDRNKFHTFANNPAFSETISSNVVIDIFEDSKGRLWFATNEGLDKFEPALGSFIRYCNKYPELPRNIKKILEDKDHNLWLSSNSGISKFNTETGEIHNYNVFDGLQGNQFFDRSGIVTQNGDLYFGGLAGFNILRPNILQSNKTAPLIYLTDFSIFNQSQKANTPNSPLKNDIGFTKEITITYSQSKMISFEYVAVNYTATQKNEYAYKLEGFDNDWHNVKHERKATYTNLPPGNYIFRVKAANNDGIWNNTGTQVRLIILPPWYLTWWFRIGVLLFIGSIIIGFYIYRTNSMRQQNKLLEENVKQRTLELAQKNAELIETNRTKDKFFSIISHDLKNPMSSVIGLSELLMNNFNRYPEEKKVLFIKTIHESTTHLYELLVNLLEWARSQTGAIRFDPKNEQLFSIVEEAIILLMDVASKKDITIENIVSDQISIFADNNMLKTIIRNIASNSIKFTPRGGKIEISSLETEKNICICIADTGIGMSQEQVVRLFSMEKNVSTHGTENESGTGLGLLLCKEFAVRHAGAIRVESEQGKGSRFFIDLPHVKKVE